MKRITLLTLAALFMLAFAGTATAAPETSMTPKVATFDFLVDYSGSMMMEDHNLGMHKFDAATRVLHRVNDRIPELGYSGSLHTFATDQKIADQAVYNRANYAAAINKLNETYEVFNRLTPMGDGIDGWSKKLYSGLAQPTAVIIVSDGKVNRGMDPFVAAQSAIAANPGLCFHVISLADSNEDQQVLDRITGLRPGCSVSVKAADLLASDAAVEQFVRDVFYGGQAKLVLRSVQFRFDSAEITNDSAAILDEVASMIKQNGRNVQIDGHTCSLGTTEYNQKLSERRAASVKSYLVRKGVAADAVSTAGYGENNPKFDNSTEQGRSLNRRAEIDFR